ncbi:MAG: LCP family protein, partial [Erysipelotrichaceae bacterium]|nr:LCP family protein [Erysipelotrichaceae bacterium]
GIITILARNSFRYVSIALNAILSILMIAGLILLPSIETRVRNIFKDVRVDEAIVSVFSTNGKYKENLSDYHNPTFIIQKRNDQENQAYAIEQIKEMLDVSSIKTIEKEDILSAVEALYNNEGDLLILNEAYIDTIEDIEKFNKFSDDTKIVTSIVKQIEVVVEKPIEKDVTNSLFTFYIAGEDTRSGRLSIYGRTDVDIVVNINPVTRQVMIIGLPRDTYIPNPALDYGYDKLTHLGNDGIQNTMKGVSEYYGIDIDYYGVVNFGTFTRIINAIGGVDIYNPYYFNGSNEFSEQRYFEFPEGDIHLTGDSALAYVRERYSLPNGDYGRSEHQTIVLKAILQKLMSADSLSMYDDLLNALQGQFLTNIEVDDIYKLIAMQLDDNSKWDIISYHMGGEGDMQGTASMGWDRKLYVVHPFKSQVEFIQQETEKMKNNEKIIQQSLPNENDSTFIPN